jgi:hypothetical protein
VIIIVSKDQPTGCVVLAALEVDRQYDLPVEEPLYLGDSCHFCRNRARQSRQSRAEAAKAFLPINAKNG